jgi:ribosomal protein L2
VVDFVRKEPGVQDVIRIEYDPGRSAHIALVKSRDPNSMQPYSYILACEGLRAGDTVQSFRQGIPDGLVPGYVDRAPTKKRVVITDPAAPQSVTAPSMSASESASASLSMGVLRALTIKPGNVLPLRLIPTGTLIPFHFTPDLWSRHSCPFGRVLRPTRLP